MKTTLALLFIILLNCNKLIAQDESVFNRLHGVSVKEALYISFDGKEFKYRNDDEKNSFALDDNIIKVSNHHKNTLITYLEFYNPLKYKIEFDKKNIDNPDFVALNEFLKSFTSSAAIQQVPTTEKVGSLPGGSVEGVEEIQESYLLYSWIYSFTNAVDIEKVKADVDGYNKLVKRINAITEIESYLYGSVAIVKNTDVNSQISTSTSELYKKDKFAEFKTEFANAKSTSSGLTKLMNEKKADFDKIIALLTDDFAIVSNFLNDNAKAAFKKYSYSLSVDLKIKTKDVFDHHNQVIKKFSDLISGLEKEIGKYDANGYKELSRDIFDWKNDKWIETSFKATLINEDGTLSSTSQTAKFSVSKDQGLALTASAGAFYTPFAYKNYGIKNQLVEETKETKVFARPAMYLNVLFKRKKGDILYWMGQVGISIGSSSPLVPIGAGFVLRNNFSLTAGGLVAWQNKLNGLELGNTADDATLKNAIERKIDIGWYISINYQFSKK